MSSDGPSGGSTGKDAQGNAANVDPGGVGHAGTVGGVGAPGSTGDPGQGSVGNRGDIGSNRSDRQRESDVTQAKAAQQAQIDKYTKTIDPMNLSTVYSLAKTFGLVDDSVLSFDTSPFGTIGTSYDSREQAHGDGRPEGQYLLTPPIQASASTPEPVLATPEVASPWDYQKQKWAGNDFILAPLRRQTNV